MQNEPQIEIYRELSCNCGSKTDVKKGCSCNSGKKININPCTPEHFAVVNYFSELVHEWEKEAARHNLGISELEGIEYVTDTGEDGEILTKVIFKYRKGHEFYTREFRVAPQGEKGDKGDKGNPGEKGEKGDDGHTPVLSKVSVNWVNDCTEEGGQFVERHGVYDLQLNLKKPDTIQQLENIIRDINNILVNNYVNKSELTNLATKQELGQFAKLSDIKDYSLVYGAGVLTLLKNGAVHSQVNILTPEERYTGNITVFQKTNSRTTPPDIIGENYSRYGWTKGIPDIDIEGEEYIWMAQCWVEKGIYGSWSVTCITGQNGEDGKDGNMIEYVYKRFSSELLTPSQHVPNIQEGTSRSEKPIATGGWTDHPQGVTKELPYEYFSFSTWQQEVGEWSSFSIPVIWSHFGQNGHDGDGVQYIFKIADSAPANPTPSDINIAAYQNGEYVPSGWTDNPRNLTTQGQKQWVCVRKYHSVNGQMKWDAYEGPTLWNYFPKDGESSTPGLEGAVIRNRGLWSDQNTYYGNDFEPNGNIKYIDIVTYAPVGDNLHYYKCIKTVTPNDNANPTNATYWTEADEIDFSYINTLISKYAQINYFNSREVRVIDANNKIVAGMTSGNQAEGDPSITNNNNVRIWAGNTYTNDPNDPDDSDTIDLNTAPFRVYEDGSMVANNATITGTFSQGNMWVIGSASQVKDINLPENTNLGFMGWLVATDTLTESNYYVIHCCGNDRIYYNGSDYGSLEIQSSGLYFIVKTNTNKFIVYKFDQATGNGTSVLVQNKDIYYTYETSGFTPNFQDGAFISNHYNKPILTLEYTGDELQNLTSPTLNTNRCSIEANSSYSSCEIGFDADHTFPIGNISVYSIDKEDNTTVKFNGITIFGITSCVSYWINNLHESDNNSTIYLFDNNQNPRLATLSRAGNKIEVGFYQETFLKIIKATLSWQHYTQNNP